MTFTYSNTDLSTTLSQVRLAIGDTDSDDPLLTDEEINHYLGLEADVYLAAVQCIEAILAKLAPKQVDRSNIGLQSSRSQKYNHYLELHKKLTARGTLRTAAPFVGGSTIADKEVQSGDSSLVTPRFARDADKNPR